MAAFVVVVGLVGAAAAGGAGERGAMAATCALPPERTTTTSEGTPSAKLLSILGVLRRPQTADDALPPPISPGNGLSFGEGVYVKFVRRARVADGMSFYVVPVEKGYGPHCSRPEGVVLEVVDSVGQGAGGVRTLADLKRGDVGGSSWRAGTGFQYGIVPDRVAKVTLRFPPRHGLRSTVTVVPLENVWVAEVPPSARGSELPSAPTAVVWRSHKGKVLRTIRPG